jgi:hypothetical protein
MRRTLRRFRIPMLVSMAALMTLSAVQLGPLATPASAEHVAKKDCSPLGVTREVETGTGINIIDQCIQAPILDVENNKIVQHYVWIWDFLRFKPAGGDKVVRATRNSQSPPYWMLVSGVVGKGEGGGAVGGRIWIKDPSGANLSRRVAVHLIMEYAPTPTSGYLNCHDLGWDEAISPQAETTSFWNNQTQPDCGDGYYRAQVAGRFWSVSQNNWITSNWHYTGSIFITTCCRRALKKEPTFRPRPPVTGNP